MAEKRAFKEGRKTIRYKGRGKYAGMYDGKNKPTSQNVEKVAAVLLFKLFFPCILKCDLVVVKGWYASKR